MIEPAAILLFAVAQMFVGDSVRICFPSRCWVDGIRFAGMPTTVHW
ncbi:MAG TPA: hypothetical protein VMU94_23910 [Streptosporangiaceae bacterium]|nr:hypothetical protein [Streptosporangiaceae bacterium]